MEYIDQLNRSINLPNPPERIVSLVPSLTELLVDMRLEDRLVGVTKFCVHPKGLKSRKAIVGGTKNFRFDVIDELKPDLIIGNKEENYKEGIDTLAEKYPVFMTDIYNLQDVYEMMKKLGEITRKEVEAQRIIKLIKRGFKKDFIYKGPTIYLIWQDPIMVVGKNTFVDYLLEKAGFTNLITAERYPEMSLEQLQELNPENVLLSSEPFPFKDKHLEEYKRLFPYANVQLVDGELFSWYGSRLVQSPDYFDSL
jgi:ABC-type Fe3+-hydroxamate transport system substrate-binding protein